MGLKANTESHVLPYAQRADFKVARASELEGKDRRFFRFLEIVPGVAAWSTIIGIVLASIYFPFQAAYFIIAFSIYWVLKDYFFVIPRALQLEAAQASYGA